MASSTTGPIVAQLAVLEFATPLSASIDCWMAELEAEIAALDERPGHFEPEAIACCGAYVSLGHDGRVRIERGYMRAEDEPSAEPGTEHGPTESGGEYATDAAGSVQHAVITIGGGGAGGTPGRTATKATSGS